MTIEFYRYLRLVSKFFGKYHPIIFFSFILILISCTVLLLYLILQTTFSPPSPISENIGNFDQKTIDRIKNLGDSSHSQDTTTVLPSSRPNPFVE